MSPLQRVVSRAVYNEEYSTSLYECMKESKGISEMILAHDLRVRELTSNPSLGVFISKLVEMKKLVEYGEGDTKGDSGVSIVFTDRDLCFINLWMLYV